MKNKLFIVPLFTIVKAKDAESINKESKTSK